MNNSWGGSEDPLTTAAVNYALGKGVLLVFSAGNAGENGMGFPGALPQVISAAATGFIKEWTACAGTGSETSWWLLCDVPEPTNPADFYITDFSSREHTGQDLDVRCPWLLGRRAISTPAGQDGLLLPGGYFDGCPARDRHGCTRCSRRIPVSRSLRQSPSWKAPRVPMGAGCRSVLPGPGAPAEQVCWGADATGEGLLDADAAVAATP